jgi:ribonuclease D
LFFDALTCVGELDVGELPPKRSPSNGLPSPASWKRLKPEAYRRWMVIRPGVVAKAEELGISPEILISPASLKSLVWTMDETDEDSWVEHLTQVNVRPWQRDIVVTLIAGLSKETETAKASSD